MEGNKVLAVPVTLKGGGNYLLWSRLVKTVIGSKGLWGHVTDGVPKPVAIDGGSTEIVVADQEKWAQEDLKVLACCKGHLKLQSWRHIATARPQRRCGRRFQKVYGNISNLSRVFEVKRAINTLMQEEEEFTKHLGKFRALWSELEMLRPNTNDEATLMEREQDQVFGLLLTLNPVYKDVIKHMLRSPKLPSFDDVCAQLQKEDDSLGLFGGKGEMTSANQVETVQANKAAYRGDERKFGGNCDHCKKPGHKRSQCWILHPHLKPSKFGEWYEHEHEGSGLLQGNQLLGVVSDGENHVYVDDIIITGSDKEGIKATKEFLKSMFEIKDLGEMKYFLGIEICRSKEGLFMSQRKYTLDLLKDAGAYGGKTARMPMEDGYKVPREGEIEDSKPFHDPKLYRKLVGKLIYLTITRPDICFAVNQVSQHMQLPKEHHWRMVERLLMYLNGSPDQGVWMGCNGSTEVVGYCDADWAGDRADRRSTTGYCTFIGGNLVTWKSKKQKVVSCSSAEAEYRAMLKLTNELVWIKGILKHLEIAQDTPMTMHCDNQAAIHIASNSVFHERTKHIEVDCHKVRQMIVLGVILPCYTRSEDQLADVFTKAARQKTMESIHIRLGLIDLGKRSS
ncbi:hypothetical protein Bca4012_103589 [Brassica carinata]